MPNIPAGPAKRTSNEKVPSLLTEQPGGPHGQGAAGAPRTGRSAPSWARRVEPGAGWAGGGLHS